jgi:hypothetical protein
VPLKQQRPISTLCHHWQRSIHDLSISFQNTFTMNGSIAIQVVEKFGLGGEGVERGEMLQQPTATLYQRQEASVAWILALIALSHNTWPLKQR